MLEMLQAAGVDAGVRPGTGAFLVLAVGFIAAEYLYRRLNDHDDDAYHPRETVASIGVAVGDVVARIVTGGLAAVPFLWLYEHRFFEIPLDTVWAWVALFLGVELCYYAFHRASHSVRWLWATHAVHHSATHFNLSAAIRLGWTGQLTGAFVFFLPLAVLGFHPVAIVAMLGAGLIYQFFLHTSLDVHLGPLEAVLNTPRHHRVHHAHNDACIDRNFGSVLIVWDRLFGTFAEAPQGEPLAFGVRGQAPSHNVIAIALGEWGRLWRDVRRVRGWRARLRLVFGPPT